MTQPQPSAEPDNQAVRSLLQGLHASQHDRFWKWFTSSKQFLNGTALVEAKIEALSAESKVFNGGAEQRISRRLRGVLVKENFYLTAYCIYG